MVKSKQQSTALILKWEESLPVFETSEPDRFVYHIHGDILSEREDGGQEATGRFGVFYVDIGAVMNAGESLFEVMDTSQVTHDFYSYLIEYGTYGWKESVQDLLKGDIIDNNLLILDRAELLPAFRGQGHGLKILRALAKRFSPGAGVIAMKPFPLQFEHDQGGSTNSAWKATLGLEAFGRNERQATAALRRYYSRLGYRRLGRTPLMLKGTTNLDPEV